MRVAAVQLTSTADKARNLETAERFINAAAADGARLIVLPEMFNVLGDAEVLQQGAETLDGPTLSRMRELAQRHGVWLVAGSIMERVAGQTKLFNTSCLFDPRGELRATYRKIHLFDCDIPGASLHESVTVMPGREIVCAVADAVPLGLSVCFDLRFPELFRVLALGGAVDRAGLRVHGAHRPRSLGGPGAGAGDRESGVPDRGESGRREFAETTLDWAIDDRRSVGSRAGAAPDREGYITADLDFAAQDNIRAQLPSLANRRPETYRDPAGNSLGSGCAPG